jgi:uncharacterized protein (DUF952 family)
MAEVKTHPPHTMVRICRKCDGRGGFCFPLRILLAALSIEIAAGHMALIYKILSKSAWEAAALDGIYTGSPVDLADGFIHFSTAAQMRGTAAKHFAGQADLVLVSFNDSDLGSKLVYEPSRGGELFPHLYGSLQTKCAISVAALPLGPDGQHVFPEDAA